MCEVKLYSIDKVWEIFEQLLKDNEQVLIRLKNADDSTYTQNFNLTNQSSCDIIDSESEGTR